MLRLLLQPEEVAASLRILHIDPGHARADLVLGYVFAAAFHAGYHAAVPICVLMLDSCLLLEAQVGEGFARSIAEGLLALRCVDGMDADLHLFIGPRLAAAGCEGVAVTDTDDQAEECG